MMNSGKKPGAKIIPLNQEANEPVAASTRILGMELERFFAVGTVVLLLASAALFWSASKTAAKKSAAREAASAKAHSAKAQTSIETKTAGGSTLVKLPAFSSSFLRARDIIIYLPNGYSSDAKQVLRYPVIYAQDGQNLFEEGYSFAGAEWGLDEAMDSLIEQGKIQPAIVVGIANTEDRYLEYMPAKPAELIAQKKDAAFTQYTKLSDPEAIASDRYLRFLVEELKPYIDRNYLTEAGPETTFLMGSSMGGLISAYALCEYPAMFSKAACISTHWPALDGVFLSYLETAIPSPSTHAFYFDHGTLNLDATYAAYQATADEIFLRKGYSSMKGDRKNWESNVFDGADHNEISWRARLPSILDFLIGK